MPITIRHFRSIDEALALFNEDLVGDELNKTFGLDGIEYLWTEGGTLTPAFTSPFASPYLYRGQTFHHQPCLPAVFRGLSSIADPRSLPPAERARLFVDRIKLEEFVIALAGHPACAYAQELGLRMQPYGLAQHYGIATDRIDLTQDCRIAAFFATNALLDGAWRPISSGSGVIYRLHTTSFLRHFKERFECLGKQALPRPGEQKGFTLSLALGMNFDWLPVEIYTFDHDEACGRRLSAQFDGGRALFPDDVMSEVADAIKAAPSLPRFLVEHLLDAPEWADQFVQSKDFLPNLAGRVSDRGPIVLSVSQHRRAREAVDAMRPTFLDGVGVLAVRDAG